jgi:hypothetical protein
MNRPKRKIHRDFITLFRKKEGEALAGRKHVNFWILSAILLFTFLAIGFANGSLRYLADKIEDPFVNWISVNIPFEKSAESRDVMEFLQDEKQLKLFNIMHVDGYMRHRLFFKHPKTNNNIPAIYRNIDPNSPIYERIMSPDNVIYGRKFTQQAHDQLGLIVSEEFFQRENLALERPFLSFNRDYNDPERLIPLPIVAVVRRLPDLVDFVVSDKLYRSLNHSGLTTDMFDLTGENSISIYVDASDEKIQSLVSEMHAVLAERNPDIVTTPFTFSHIEGHLLRLYFFPEPRSLNELDSLYSILESKLNSADFHIRTYNYFSRWEAIADPGRYDFISINFNDLNKLREFSEFLEEQFDLRIEFSQLESRENYHLITRLAVIVSLILIIFSILSVCLFISNLLHRHLFEIRQNLGTFKAFGLDNKTLKKIYTFIIIRFLSTATAFAILISFFIGVFGGMRLIMQLTGANLEDGQNYFHLFGPWTISAVVLIALISIIVLTFTANAILKKSPGDLVNDR